MKVYRGQGRKGTEYVLNKVGEGNTGIKNGRDFRKVYSGIRNK